ncbi:hypothetical protein [Sinorhizobium sp. BG8]|uniref:hypothetical protein n=1 Tax=Sinorhizobium sp. BG8 TaxID=2613773 RepID=UPI00193CC49D|nr:hypothetical protein [Sinorhizobium sp. BG8]QRM55122.1 hypothetical protein F3Y30_11705 [Sinorhizobium sp. BG8]
MRAAPVSTREDTAPLDAEWQSIHRRRAALARADRFTSHLMSYAAGIATMAIIQGVALIASRLN